MTRICDRERYCVSRLRLSLYYSGRNGDKSCAIIGACDYWRICENLPLNYSDGALSCKKSRARASKSTREDWEGFQEAAFYGGARRDTRNTG